MLLNSMEVVRYYLKAASVNKNSNLDLSQRDKEWLYLFYLMKLKNQPRTDYAGFQ